MKFPNYQREPTAYNIYVFKVNFIHSSLGVNSRALRKENISRYFEGCVKSFCINLLGVSCDLSLNRTPRQVCTQGERLQAVDLVDYC